MTIEEVSGKMDQMLMGIREELAAQKEQIKGALKRIDEQAKLTESVHELATSIKIMANEQKTLTEKVSNLTGDVDALKQKPAKRYDDVVKLIITAIVTAGITLVLTQIGLK